jgi:hypothetical protein
MKLKQWAGGYDEPLKVGDLVDETRFKVNFHLNATSIYFVRSLLTRHASDFVLSNASVHFFERLLCSLFYSRGKFNENE